MVISRFAFFSIVCASARMLCSQEQQSYWHYHPLHVGGQLISIGKAECYNERPNHQHHLGNLHFRKTNAFTSMLVPVNRDHIFIPQIQFNYVTLDWNKNQKFHETDFYYMQFVLMYYTTALDKWKWIVRFDYNLQLEHTSQAAQYSLYNGLIWGSNQIHRKWHYHIGALGYAGLRGSNIYPILGVDYSPGERWFIQAVFPINYSVEYKLSKWTFAAKIRPTKERLRTGPHEPQPRSIFSYSSLGSELNIRYDRQFKLSIEGYGGWNWGGDFYIKDCRGKHAQYVNLRSAIYGGLMLNYGF
jgi:hypothetical protein